MIIFNLISTTVDNAGLRIKSKHHTLVIKCIKMVAMKFSNNKCDRILENSSKLNMKSSVFVHVFNDISTYVYVFMEYFLHSFSNLSIEFLVVL